MTAARFALGLVALAGILGPAVLVGWKVQAILPSRGPALRVLAAAIVALGTVLVTAELLGAVGLFALVPLLVASPALAVAAVAALRRWGPAPVPAGSPTPRPEELATDDASPGDHVLPSWLRAGICLVVVGVGARWMAYGFERLSSGILDPDSVQYHLPFAAEFASTGWLTRFQPVWFDPTQLFYPANAEVLQAVGFVALGRDVLAPLASLGWFALLLTAGWCVGVRDRVAPLTLLVTVWVTAIPLLSFSNAGSAVTDVGMLACLTAAVALWRNAEGHAGWTAVSGLALGLGVGIKLTLLPTAGILALAMVAVAPKELRRRWFGLVLGSVAVGCGYWFLRNLLRTGSPLPSVHLPFLHRTELEVVDTDGYSVSHYLFDGDVWRTTFWPGLKSFFGWSGILVAASVVAGVTAVVRAVRRDRLLLGLVVAGAVGAVAYLFVPAGAWGPEGRPMNLLFMINLRYVLPGLLVLALVTALATARAPQRVRLAFGGGLVLAAGVALIDYPSAYEPKTRFTAAGVVVALVGGAAAFAVHRGVRPPAMHSTGRRIGVAVMSAGALVVVGAVGAAGARSQLQSRTDRYAGSPTYALVDSLPTGSRIGYFGLVDDYRLRGVHWDNDAVYLGVAGPKGAFRVPRDCREYVAVLERLDVEYAIVADASAFTIRQTDVPSWTRTQPGAEVLVVDPPFTTFRISGPYDPELCDTAP